MIPSDLSWAGPPPGLLTSMIVATPSSLPIVSKVFSLPFDLGPSVPAFAKAMAGEAIKKK